MMHFRTSPDIMGDFLHGKRGPQVMVYTGIYLHGNFFNSTGKELSSVFEENWLKELHCRSVTELRKT